jgi:choline dehydrogenase-like flavoprotein
MSTTSIASGLSSSQRATLSAVCETLLPAISIENDPHGFYATGARAAGTVNRVEQLIAAIRDPRDRARLRQLLTVLGSAALNLVLSGRFAPFIHMDRHDREAVLRSWAHSRLPLRRAGFQALKRLTHVAYLTWPIEERTNPAWRAVGHPGPLPQPSTQVAPLAALCLDRETTLDCDVVVVGSGAGGGVVAGLLAEAGKDVVVLERGPNPGSRELTQIEGDMLSSLYLDGGLLMTQSGSMPILAGSCVGGGTTINYTTSFPLPDATREEWDRVSGLSLFTGTRFGDSLDRVAARLNVGTRWTTPGRRDALLERCCRTLGWHVDLMPRNVTDCVEGLECGYCGYGCRHGAKNSTAKTYLTDAVARGARLIPHCDADRVLSDAGRATGVSASVRDREGHVHCLTVRAGVVVVAAGAIYTPAILRRSGLTNRNIGRGLRLHPATAVLGVYPDRVEPWSGSLQTRYSDQFADLEGGYGVKFETAPAHFALVGSAFGWESARQFRDDVVRLGHVSLVGVLLRDRDAGRVAVGRDGQPRVHYELSNFDERNLRRAFGGAADVLAASGATEIFTLHTPPVRVRTGDPGWQERFKSAADARGYRRCRMSYISFHQMGSAAIGSDPKRSVLDEQGEVHELRGLFVADGSACPTSSGVNPMVTIMAIADHVGRGIAEGL